MDTWEKARSDRMRRWKGTVTGTTRTTGGKRGRNTRKETGKREEEGRIPNYGLLETLQLEPETTKRRM